MYLTAQRVGGRFEGRIRQGINAYLYLHVDRSLPQTPEGAIDIASVADAPPGDRVEGIESVTPGGNRVFSYLDVAGEDEIAIDELRRALERFEEHVPRTSLDVRFEETGRIGDVSVGIYLSEQIGLKPEFEYRSLCESVLRLLAIHRGDDSRNVLRFTEERGDGEWIFRPLSTGLDVPGLSAREHDIQVRVDDETLKAFEGKWGSIYPVLAESIFGMGIAELLEHGGVELVDPAEDGIRWRGP